MSLKDWIKRFLNGRVLFILNKAPLYKESRPNGTRESKLYFKSNWILAYNECLELIYHEY